MRYQDGAENFWVRITSDVQTSVTEGKMMYLIMQNLQVNFQQKEEKPNSYFSMGSTEIRANRRVTLNYNN